MSNVLPDNKIDDHSDSAVSTSLLAAADVVSDLISDVTLPAPIKRNALKALSQLCTAAIDVPVALLEGFAAERRAETQARIKLISHTSDQIARGLVVSPEYSNVAARKFGAKIVREQVNLDKISVVAAEQLLAETPLSDDLPEGSPTPAEINDDWLNAFEQEARHKSTEEMQQIFGRILAGEIAKTSSFSVKTIKLVAQLDDRVASLFRRLCSLSISLKIGPRIIDARVVSLNGSASNNSLAQYGLSFDQLNVLNEYGLIIPEYNSWMDYQYCIAKGGVVNGVMRFENVNWGLVPKVGSTDDRQPLKLHGVGLTQAGRELMQVVEIETNAEYRAALFAHFETNKLDLVQLS